MARHLHSASVDETPEAVYLTGLIGWAREHKPTSGGSREGRSGQRLGSNPDS